MDKDQLVKLLQASQIPDTEKVKAVTSELQKNYYSQPQSLLHLIEIAITHDEAGMRQLAAVQAARIAKRHWEKIAQDQRTLARQHLIQGTLKDAADNVRRSLSRLVAVIAGLDMESEEGKEFLRTIIGLNMAPDTRSREVGSYIVYAVVDNDPVPFSDHIDQLLQLFGNTINDSESKEVSVNTIKALGALLILVEPEEDEKSLAAIQAMFPSMVRILKDAIATSNSDHYGEIFEVLQSFLAYDPALINKHLKDLIVFMMEVASNTRLEDDARSQALAFLTQSVHSRRMKIQAMRDVAPQLMTTALKVVTEMEDDMLDDDDMDELSPVRTALMLIDQLASDLPPRLVINPLLDDFPKLAQHSNSAYRKAAILALGAAAGGSPDFISTQLKPLLPIIVGLLNDPDESVRHAALAGTTQLADEMAEDFAPSHKEILESIIKNVQAASQESSNKKNVSVLRAACDALNSVGIANTDENITKAFGQELLKPLGNLLSHENLAIKAAAASAIGSIAAALGESFMPYFKEVMTALGQHLVLNEGAEQLGLRAATCDAMGDIANAVGAEAFQPYVMDLMKASEEGLALESSSLKETSFLLWGQLSKLYGVEFAQFLPGVFKGLWDAMEMEEQELHVDSGLVDGAAEGDVIIVGGKKLRIKKDEGSEIMDDDSEWGDIDDFNGVTAEAMQQEVAIEVLGDVICSACNLDGIKEYLEPSLEKLKDFTDHSYDGCRKATLSTLWRTYVRVYQLMMPKDAWKPSLAKDNPFTQPALRHIAELVTDATLKVWPNDPERSVISVINQNFAEALKSCGPAILAVNDMEKQMIIIIASVLTRCHPCQQDFGDEADVDAEGGTSEYDWLVIDTALDVIIGMAAALGPHFVNHWIVFSKPIIKLASSQESTERSTATGTIAEVIKYLGGAVTAYTEPLSKILMKRLTDTDELTKSNAAFAIGQLVLLSSDPKVLGLFEEIVVALEPALDTKGSTMQDNIAGCFARLMVKNPDANIVAKLLPLVVGVLPLKQDFEENPPIFQCIANLYEVSNPTVQELTPQLVPVFKTVLGEPEEQLDEETRTLVNKIVHVLHQHRPELFQ